MISFFVAGVPAGKGSMRAFWHKHLGRAMVKNDSKRTAPWEQAVARHALVAGAVLHDGPMRVDLSFRLPRPKGHIGKRGLRRSAPTAHTVKPDIDKLARACLDALTGVCWHDDAQVSELTVEKLYAGDVYLLGLYVTVRSRESAGPTLCNLCRDFCDQGHAGDSCNCTKAKCACANKSRSPSPSEEMTP